MEERALANILQQLKGAEDLVHSLEREGTALAARRSEDVGVVMMGIDHQQGEAEQRELKARRVNAAAEIERLQGMRIKQMAAYERAHCDREVIAQLQQQRVAAYEAASRTREQRLNDDLFL